MARCDAVQQWDEGAFQKAYKWANYFEEVYRRLKIKPPLAQKLDKYLENFNKSGQICLGNFKLSLEVLGKSKSLLRQFLLQNCHLTESQYQLTLQLYGLRVGDAQDCGNNNDLITDAYHLSKTKASLHLLCKMRDRLTEDMRLSKDRAFMPTSSRPHLSNGEEFLSAVSSEEVCMDVTAHCLFKQVQHQLTFGDTHSRRKVLFEKLQVLAEQTNGLRSIITSLLFTSDDCQSGERGSSVTQLILEWLLEFLSKPKPNPCLMSVPSRLLGRVAFMYEPFFKLYLSHLLSWAENMVPGYCCNEENCHTSRGIQWRYKLQDHHDKDEKDLAFTNLLNHFGHLVTGPDSIADAIKKELQSRSVERDLAVMSDDRRKTFGSLELNIWEDICDVVPFSQ